LRDATVAVDHSVQHPLLNELEQYLLDDLNTAQALAALHALATEINKAMPSEKPALQKALRKAGDFLGLLPQDSEAWFRWQPASSTGGLSDTEIDQLIVDRNDAKKAKDYQRADQIRQELKAQGIVLEDSK